MWLDASMAMQYDAVASSRPGNRVERLLREKGDGKIDKTMWNQPDLRSRGTNQDQDEYGFPLGSETPSIQVICSEISASESPSLPCFRTVLCFTEVICETRFSFPFFFIFVPQATLKIKMQLSEVATSNQLIFSAHLSLSHAILRLFFIMDRREKQIKQKTYPRERGDCWSISYDLVLMISHQSQSKIHAYEHAWCVPAARITNEPIMKLCVQNISLPSLQRTWCERDTRTSWKFLKIAQETGVFFTGCWIVRK